MPICMSGIWYYSSEAAYQGQKTSNKVSQEKISLLTPSDSKKLGQALKTREDWDQVKIYIMTMAVLKKFEANSRLAFKLKETGNTLLVETNTWNDTFWGQDTKGNGLNHLGKILMEVRDII